MSGARVEALVAERPGALGSVLVSRAVSVSDSLGAGEVAVRMVASTVNPSDVVTVSGAYGSITSFPFIPGFEGLGVIEQAGPGVPPSVVGARVLPIGSASNWQQIKRTDYAWCIPIPDDIPDTVACFAYINPLTALLMVERYCSGDVRNVAITAATSTIAGHLAELLNLRGIRPIGIARRASARQPDDSSLWGAIIDTSIPAWADRVQAAAGPGGLDVILDCVGGVHGAVLMQALGRDGVFVHYGLLSGEPLPTECFAGDQGKRVEMFRLRDIIHAHPRDTLAELFAPVFEHMRAGRLHTPLARHVHLSSLPEAIREGTATGSGKTLITYSS